MLLDVQGDFYAQGQDGAEEGSLACSGGSFVFMQQ